VQRVPEPCSDDAGRVPAIVQTAMQASGTAGTFWKAAAPGKRAPEISLSGDHGARHAGALLKEFLGLSRVR
jgi:hypothetical protein